MYRIRRECSTHFIEIYLDYAHFLHTYMCKFFNCTRMKGYGLTWAEPHHLTRLTGRNDVFPNFYKLHFT